MRTELNLKIIKMEIKDSNSPKLSLIYLWNLHVFQLILLCNILLLWLFVYLAFPWLELHTLCSLKLTWKCSAYILKYMNVMCGVFEWGSCGHTNQLGMDYHDYTKWSTCICRMRWGRSVELEIGVVGSSLPILSASYLRLYTNIKYNNFWGKGGSKIQILISL